MPAPDRLQKIFARVVRFAGVSAKLKIGCKTIDEQRKVPGLSGRRSFMHVGDVPGAVCAHPAAKKLSDAQLIGLFLHELGHLATGSGDAQADAWVFTALGIPIEYRGKLMLEWVDPEIIKEKRI